MRHLLNDWSRALKEDQRQYDLERDRTGRSKATFGNEPLRRPGWVPELGYNFLAVMFLKPNGKLYSRQRYQRFSRRVTVGLAREWVMVASKSNCLMFVDDQARHAFIGMLPRNDPSTAVRIAHMVASEFTPEEPLFATLTHYLKSRWWLPEQWNEESHRDWLQAFGLGRRHTWQNLTFGLPPKVVPIPSRTIETFETALDQVRHRTSTDLPFIRRDQFEERQKFALGHITLLRDSLAAKPGIVPRNKIPMDVWVASMS